MPYGDGLYYRVVVGRKVEYRDKQNNAITEYAPSHASKIAASLVVPVAKPPAPVLRYASRPITPKGYLNDVVLFWDKTCYNGKYHLYKMNNQGNWFKIHEVSSNDATIFVQLQNTSLQSGTLATKTVEGETVYHHFKVVAENTGGLLSSKENILTIHNPDIWVDVDDL